MGADRPAGIRCDPDRAGANYPPSTSLTARPRTATGARPSARAKPLLHGGESLSCGRAHAAKAPYGPDSAADAATVRPASPRRLVAQDAWFSARRSRVRIPPGVCECGRPFGRPLRFAGSRAGYTNRRKDRVCPQAVSGADPHRLARFLSPEPRKDRAEPRKDRVCPQAVSGADPHKLIRSNGSGAVGLSHGVYRGADPSIAPSAAARVNSLGQPPIRLGTDPRRLSL